MYQLGKSWDFAATWVFASGQTGTIATHEYDGLKDPLSWETINSSLDYVSERNNYRFKPYHRLDLSITYTKHHKRGKSLWNLSVYNVYNQMNPFIVTPVSEIGSDHSYRTVLQPVSYTHLTLPTN